MMARMVPECAGTLVVMATMNGRSTGMLAAMLGSIFNRMTVWRLRLLVAPNYATAHMAEEVQDASITVPRAIMTSAVVNGSLGWIMTITY